MVDMYTSGVELEWNLQLDGGNDTPAGLDHRSRKDILLWYMWLVSAVVAVDVFLRAWSHRTRRARYIALC